MKRVISAPVILLVLASLACSLPAKVGMNTTSPKATSTQSEVIIVEEATATQPKPTNTVEMPTEPPTQTPSPTETDAPVETPTSLPTETIAAPQEFIDTFDRNSKAWSEDFIVTTQTFGRDLQSKGIIQDGALTLSFLDKETYLYKFYNEPVGEDVTIEAEYQATGHINNSTALVCKVNDDRTRWLEIRVSSTSDFSFYLYDKQRKTVEGKNPYLQLSKGKFKINELYPTMPNKIKLTCLDNELIVSMNDDMRVLNQDLETPVDGSGVGVGAMSYDVVPIRIRFETITIRPGE